ncbi:hypothetical protein JW826_05245 [Candidatus Woesearchaeota archaeon]|nr:hypothetical protein [Candidatus Woesearchaeota archaeon]
MILGLIALMTIFSVFVWADSDYPYGMREVNFIQSSRSNVSAYTPDNIEAEAGNVTELSLVGISTTRGWQGYYGNISGIITLEDAFGYVFYNWSATEPKGEIYASVNNSISWSDVVCFNWTGQSITLEGEEARYGFGDDSADGINETFTNAGLDSDLFVGSLNITGNATTLGYTCHTTNPFQYGFQNSNTDNFENFLLADVVSGALIFGAVIENDDFDNETDIRGYNNNTYDFQLLVAENGFDGFEDTTTTYYFWAELE